MYFPISHTYLCHPFSIFICILRISIHTLLAFSCFSHVFPCFCHIPNSCFIFLRMYFPFPRTYLLSIFSYVYVFTTTYAAILHSGKYRKWVALLSIKLNKILKYYGTDPCLKSVLKEKSESMKKLGKYKYFPRIKAIYYLSKITRWW